MNPQRSPVTPLLRALLVYEGLIAPEQLEACLLLQEHDYPQLELGEIMLRCGYISREGLEQVEQLQREMHTSLLAAFEAQVPALLDVDVLVIARRPSEALTALLAGMGAAARYSSVLPDDLEWRRPELVLVESALLARCSDLPETLLVELLPPELDKLLYLDTASPALRKFVERYVHRARNERARRQLVEDLRQRDFELHVLALAARGIAGAISTQALLSQLMVLVRDMLLVEAATLLRVHADGKSLWLDAVLGPHQHTLGQRHIPIGQGIAGWVARHGEPLIIPDVRYDARFDPSVDNAAGVPTHSMICAPLMVFGSICGVIQLINKQGDEFTERDLQLLRVIAAFGALALASGPAAPHGLRMQRGALAGAPAVRASSPTSVL